MPPSTIWPMTPPTRPSDSHVRSRRRGSRTRAPSTARMTAIATTPVKRRFTCSIAPWVLDTSTKLLRLHSGQSGQPRPEPVRRTSAPVTMITARASAASRVRRRYVAGRSRQRRGSTPSRASSVRSTMAAEGSGGPCRRPFGGTLDGDPSGGPLGGNPSAGAPSPVPGAPLGSAGAHRRRRLPDPPDARAARPTGDVRPQPLRPLLLQRRHRRRLARVRRGARALPEPPGDRRRVQRGRRRRAGVRARVGPLPARPRHGRRSHHRRDRRAPAGAARCSSTPRPTACGPT